MRPIKLQIEGFTSFKKKIEIDFSRLQVFSITGVNGAGKSSLLEAIIFALYGFTPKTGKEKKELVSQGENELNVLLEFSIAAESYRVSRRFKIVGAPYATIEKQSNGNWLTLAEGDAAVTDRVEQLLRMPYDAFIQAVIVPQDQFAAFLRPGKPKERRNMLMQMFDLQVYERMRQRAQDRHLQAKQLSDTLETQWKGRYKEATAENLAERKKIKKKLQSEVKSLKALQSELKVQDQLAQRVVQLKERIRNQSQKTNTAADQLRKERERKAELEKAFADWNREQVARSPQLLQEIARLSALREKFQSIEKQQQEADSLKQKLQIAEDDISVLRQSLESKEVNLKKLERRLDQSRKQLSDYNESLFEAITSLSGVFVQIADAKRRQQKGEEELKREQQKRDSLEKEIPQLQRQLDKQETELNKVEQEYHEAERVWHVYELRMGIEPGADCPVCGTTLKEHPVISSTEKARAEKDLNRLQKKRKDIQEQLEISRPEVAIKNAEKNSISRKVQQLQEELQSTKTEIEKLKHQIAQTIEIPQGSDPFVFAVQQQAKVQEARKKNQALRSEIEKLEKTFAAEEKDRQSKTHEMELKRQEANFVELRLMENENTLGALRAELGLAEASAVADILEKSRVLQEELDGIRQEESRLKEENDRAAGGLTTLERAYTNELQSLQQFQSEMEQFSSEEQNLEKSDLDTIHTQLEKTHGDLEELNKKLGEASRHIDEIETEIREAQKLKEELKDAQKERDLFGQLAAMLRNDRLQNYVFGRLMRSLVDNCNIILRDLTLGKYALDLDKNEDLIICDFWNGGGRRSVRTLSGGETFVVSLALALALSSAVKGGIHIESLFLDEGFGSLDKQRLDLVRDALLKLQLYDKLVGVVTHLEDFANAFPAQLSVIGASDGSQVIMSP